MAKETIKKSKKSNNNTKKVTKTNNDSTKKVTKPKTNSNITKKVAKEKVTSKKPTKNITKGQEVMRQFDTKATIESKKLLIIIISVVAVLGLFYLIAGIITGTIDLNKNEPAEIQYSEILAGSTFKQDDTEYLVLYYDFTQDDASEYTNLVSTYTSSENSVSIYTVDLSRKFNSSYIKTEEETVNTNPTNAEELKVKNPTLIKIKDKQVIEYKEGFDEIKNYMS